MNAGDFSRQGNPNSNNLTILGAIRLNKILILKAMHFSIKKNIQHF